MASARFALVAAIALLAAQDAEGLKAKVSPVRRVINMLTMMQRKCEEEASKEEQIFEKFMCSCKGNKDNLMKSVADAQDRIPQLESVVQESKAHKDQLGQDIEQQKADRQTASNTIEQAEAMRHRDKTAFDRDSADMTTNINALATGIAALESVRDGDFLQTGAGQVLGRLSSDEKLPVALLSRHDREALGSFLQAGSGDTGEILGILNHMRQDMVQDLQAMTQQETSAVASFEAISLAKKREIAVASAAIQDKQGRFGEISVLYVEQQHDLSDTREGLAADESMLTRYQEECDARQKNYAVVQATLAEEKVAIADTVKILNDEDSQRLFARTLPGGAGVSVSFLQLDSRNSAAELQAVHAAQHVAANFPDQPQLGLLANRAVATARRRSSSPGFAKIIALVEKMIELMGKHQEEDDRKKEMCTAELQKQNDHKATLEAEITAKTAALENTKDQVDAIAKEIGDLRSAISDLDQSVSVSTQQRKNENAGFLELLAGNNAAVQLLQIAQSRLEKFYNPNLYQPATAPTPLVFLQTSNDDSVATDFAAITGEAAPEIFGGVQIQPLQIDGMATQALAAPQEVGPAQDPPPGQDGSMLLQASINDSGSSQAQAQDEFGFFDSSSDSSRQSMASSNVVQMLQMLQADLQHEIVAAKAEEEHSQQDYESLMSASQAKRQADAAAITEKEGVRAALKESMGAEADAKEDLTKEKLDTEQVIFNLHHDCDLLMENFDVRSSSRAGEKESLQRALSVLHGADVSLAQSAHHH